MMNLKDLLLANDPVAILRELDAAGALHELDPAIAELRMPMPGHVHHKDNLLHSIQVLANAIARETSGPDLILRTAALLHDIGKPATRKFQGRKTVTFDGHEIAGARMVRVMLKSHDYTKSEITKISQLVALHMRSHGFSDKDWSDSAVRRLITDVGDDVQLERLLILFYSDATTKNPKMLKLVHDSVAHLTDEIARVKALDARSALRPALDGHEVMKELNLKPGRELGAIMKFLNTDEGIKLTRDEALAKAREILQS